MAKSRSFPVESMRQKRREEKRREEKRREEKRREEKRREEKRREEKRREEKRREEKRREEKRKVKSCGKQAQIPYIKATANNRLDDSKNIILVQSRTDRNI
ncbi:hypothetical protein llap_19835 [Limosa lapponica baueri]|uniref:Uncharacterized protein n=1 Tax=Limosa lapponica baueri TaxID=1758121 RepID=A0A2I0T7U3_LIMLA|nr:hypothetical protein llap_19835 [Limosa lapponica baueri]